MGTKTEQLLLRARLMREFEGNDRSVLHVHCAGPYRTKHLSKHGTACEYMLTAKGGSQQTTQHYTVLPEHQSKSYPINFFAHMSQFRVLKRTVLSLFIPIPSS